MKPPFAVAFHLILWTSVSQSGCAIWKTPVVKAQNELIRQASEHFSPRYVSTDSTFSMVWDSLTIAFVPKFPEKTLGSLTLDIENRSSVLVHVDLSNFVFAFVNSGSLFGPKSGSFTGTLTVSPKGTTTRTLFTYDLPIGFEMLSYSFDGNIFVRELKQITRPFIVRPFSTDSI